MYAKSRYSISRFFTPPRISKLNLDLAELSGGGHGPAEFEGKTHDGREVYCRYRGGWLSVTIANFVGGDCLYDGTEILGVQLGPPVDGGMTLGHLCRYAGITIKGVLPPPPTAEEIICYSAKDLSGHQSYFNVWLDSTHSTQRAFLGKMLREFDHCRIVEPVVVGRSDIVGWRECKSADDISADFFSVVHAVKWNPDILSDARGDTTIRELLPDAIVVDVRASGFKHLLHKYVDHTASWVKRTWGLQVMVAGQCDEMLHGTFSLHSSYRKDDAEAFRFLRKMDSLIDEVFPAFRLDEFDVLTGERFGDKEYIGHFDPAIAQWISEDNSRWLYLRREGAQKTQRPVGGRLIRAEGWPPEQ